MHTRAADKDGMFYVEFWQKQAIFSSVYVYFSSTIFKQNDKIFYAVLQQKQATGKLFVK